MNAKDIIEQVGEHLGGLDLHMRDLRQQMLPRPPSKLVWEMGSMCRLAGARLIALTAELEKLEAGDKAAPPVPHCDPEKQGVLF